MKNEHFQRCQVATPSEVVAMLWRLSLERRGGVPFETALDMGAGDARFAQVRDAYVNYTGIELDPQKAALAQLPRGATIVVADAMKCEQRAYDICIGNPPYIRHHHLERKWRDEALATLAKDTGVNLKKTANAFVLFLLQALRQTAEHGLVVQLVPFEWVTRPSAKELREYIDKMGWSVEVYRFDTEIFPTVLTTASVTIIDKAPREGEKRRKKVNWQFGVIGANGQITRTAQPSGTSGQVLRYAKRSDQLFGLRGLSPGGQDIFVLTEEERLHFSLQKRRDVIPCVTSLRHLPPELTALDADTFNTHFVKAGRRCWLIRSDRTSLSDELQAYLTHVGKRWQAYTTCTTRAVWWQYRPHPSPELLFSSGFVGKGTKVLTNHAAAIAVGAVYGIICQGDHSSDGIASKLRSYDFRRHVVSHANNLKKVEVRQLNAVLEEIA